MLEFRSVSNDVSQAGLPPSLVQEIAATDETPARLRTAVRRALLESDTVRIVVEGRSNSMSAVLGQLQAVLERSLGGLHVLLDHDALVIRESPTSITFEDLQAHLHRASSHFLRDPTSLSDMDDAVWDQHLLYAQQHIQSERQKRGDTLRSSHLRSRLRGRCAELVLQSALMEYAQHFMACGRPLGYLCTRDQPLRFPLTGESRRMYGWRPTTEHNAEIHVSDVRPDLHATRRGAPLISTSRRLTEVDAAIVTDLQQNGSGRLFWLFDATTSRDQLHEKLLLKTTALEDLIQDMNRVGVNVQIVNVLIHRANSGGNPHELEREHPGHVQTMKLPLASLVDRLTLRTAADLQLSIEE